MSKITAQEIYDQHIKPLSAAERLHLVEMVAPDLSRQTDHPTMPAKRDIMELHGLGKEIWEGIDAQEYVNQLRSEWDDRYLARLGGKN